MKSLHVDQFNHDEWAEDYDLDVADESHPIREGYERVLDWVTHEAHIGEDSSVLELGSGTGNLTKRITECRKIVCVDISTEMEALAAAKTNHLPREFIKSDLLEVFESAIGTFDRIISTYAIHHLTEPEKSELFRKVWDCLSDGGLAVFGDLMVENRKVRQEKIRYYCDNGQEEVALAIEGEFFWDIEESIQKLNDIGFSMKIERFSDLSYGIAARKSINSKQSVRGTP